MKSNRGTPSPATSGNISNLHQSLSQEKEALVTMFLSSASQHELTEQIKKIDALCCRIDQNHRGKLPE